MIYRACAIFDHAASVFTAPFFVRHIAEAKRSVQQSLQDKRSMMAQYPDQFSLWEIGTYDDATGVMSPQAGIIICQIAAMVQDAAPPSVEA